MTFGEVNSTETSSSLSVFGVAFEDAASTLTLSSDDTAHFLAATRNKMQRVKSNASN